MKKKDIIEIEIIKLYYLSSRENIINRIKARDTVLTFFIGAIGVLIGISFDESGSIHEIPLMIIPFITFGTTILTNYHNEYVARIAYYIGNDLEVRIRKVQVDVTEWSSSRAHFGLRESNYFGSNRNFANAIILLSPTLFVLLITLESFLLLISKLIESGFCSLQIFESIFLWGWIVGFILLILSFVTQISSNKFFKKIYDELPYLDRGVREIMNNN